MKRVLLAIIAMVGIAGAETLTGKIANYNIGSKAQVCMNGSCIPVGSDGSYSLNVSTDGIASRHSGVGASADLYRLGQFVVSASGRQVELINMKGQRITSDKGSLDISKVPKGVYMATDGKHVLRLNTMSKSGYAASGSNGTMANGVAARATDATQLYGIAYVVVKGDTLREIPVTSWNLPTGYMVARSHSVRVPSKFAADTAQIVYWTNDSIAYVVNFGKNSQTKGTTYRSAFIYCMYDSAAYTNGDSAYQYFYRVRKDTILAYTDIGVAEAGSGDAEMADSSSFHLTTYNRTGWSYVPALDTLKKWADSTELNYNGQWISIDSLKGLEGRVIDSLVSYQVYYYITGDTTYWASVLSSSDSVEFTYNTIGRPGVDTSDKYSLYIGWDYTHSYEVTVKSTDTNSVVTIKVPVSVFSGYHGLTDPNSRRGYNDVTGGYSLAVMSHYQQGPIEFGTKTSVRFHIKN